MRNFDTIATCLSAERHDRNGADEMLHYFGCLEFCEREEYFDWLDEEQQKKVDSELRRIKYLRHALQHDKEDTLLLTNLNQSIKKWRGCELFNCQEGIRAVQAWRSSKGRLSSKQQRDPPDISHLRSPAYDPDRDLDAYLIRYWQGEELTELKDARFNSSFPNHKMAVSRLLNEKDSSNPLSRDSQPEHSINYFHFPANNMHLSLTLYYNTPVSYLFSLSLPR